MVAIPWQFFFTMTRAFFPCQGCGEGQEKSREAADRGVGFRPCCTAGQAALLAGKIFWFSEALAKMVHFVILNVVKDLNLMKIRDSSLRSE
jgi:hypothetical protein